MIKRFALWLWPDLRATIDATRLKCGTDAVERGMRWEAFWREEGGLADILAKLRQEAFEAAQEAGAKDDQTRLAWMLQDRAYRQLQNRIEAIVISGKNEVSNRRQQDRDKAIRIVRAEF